MSGEILLPEGDIWHVSGNIDYALLLMLQLFTHDFRVNDRVVYSGARHRHGNSAKESEPPKRRNPRASASTDTSNKGACDGAACRHGAHAPGHAADGSQLVQEPRWSARVPTRRLEKWMWKRATPRTMAVPRSD